MGLGVVVFGEWKARGMELVVRSVDRGCGGLVGLSGGRAVVVNFEVETGGKGEGGDSGRASLLAAAASSHAARAEGSIGHVVCGGSFGGVWIFVEEVLPMIMRLRSGQLYLHADRKTQLGNIEARGRCLAVE